jgi:hypothetical protein
VVVKFRHEVVVGRWYLALVGCIFHGTGNSAQLCQNFGISRGGLNTPTPPLGTPLVCRNQFGHTDITLSPYMILVVTSLCQNFGISGGLEPPKPPSVRHRFCSLLNPVRDGMNSQRHTPAALPLEKSPGAHSTGGWVGARAGLNGCGEDKTSCPPPGFESRTVQPVASSYTDYAIPTTYRRYVLLLSSHLLLVLPCVCHTYLPKQSDVT